MNSITKFTANETASFARVFGATLLGLAVLLVTLAASQPASAAAAVLSAAMA